MSAPIVVITDDHEVCDIELRTARAERDRARDLVAFLESETDPGNAETVERVAEVIWSHDWNNNLAGSWKDQPDGWRAPYRVIARTVLTSLRRRAELDAEVER